MRPPLVARGAGQEHQRQASQGGAGLGFGVSHGGNGADMGQVCHATGAGALDQECEEHLGYPYVKLTQGGSGSRKAVLT